MFVSFSSKFQASSTIRSHYSKVVNIVFNGKFSSISLSQIQHVGIQGNMNSFTSVPITTHWISIADILFWGRQLLFPAIFIANVLATGLTPPESASGVQRPVTCGRYPHKPAQINGALNRGVKLMKEKKQVKNYPHTFNNREEFEFDVEGPYQEFPILRNGQIFDGGK